MSKDLNFLLEGPIAHRGYHNDKLNIPENSIKAFKKAIRNNLIIELDVHILKDNNVVVFHDDNLKRMTGKNKVLKDLTYDDLKNINLKNSNEKIPLFKDVLKLIDGKVPIIIELKCDTKKYRLEKEVYKILKDYNGKYAVKSFNPFSILYFRFKDNSIIRGQLSSDFKNTKRNKFEKIMLSNMIFNIITKPDFISYDIRALNDKKIKKYKNKRVLLGWTIKNDRDFRKFSNKLDNVICENVKL